LGDEDVARIAVRGKDLGNQRIFFVHQVVDQRYSSLVGGVVLVESG
jgi:hypothetical protein